MRASQVTADEWAAVDIPRDVGELEQLCADQDLVSCEVFAPNAYYGVADVIKRWANVPVDRPLMIALPHGVGFDQAPYTHHELVPAVACFSSDEAQVARRLPLSRLWMMAAPYVHLVRMAPSVPMTGRKGSVFFPSHSTAEEVALCDLPSTINQLRSLPSRFHPIVVCMYWRDVQRGTHREYADAGFDVVSAGHVYDRRFLYRFHKVCSSRRFALSYSLGSHVFLAIRAGCQVVPIDGDPLLVRMSPDGSEEVRIRQSALWQSQPVYARALSTYRRLSEMTHDAQLAWANRYLGMDYLRSPAQTADLIARAERLDRFGFFAERGATVRRNPLTVPTAYRRAFRRRTPRALRSLGRGGVQAFRRSPSAIGTFDPNDVMRGRRPPGS
jgi:hypothetical protein